MSDIDDYESPKYTTEFLIGIIANDLLDELQKPLIGRLKDRQQAQKVSRLREALQDYLGSEINLKGN